VSWPREFSLSENFLEYLYIGWTELTCKHMQKITLKKKIRSFLKYNSIKLAIYKELKKQVMESQKANNSRFS
jgi:hypothetical protein